MDNNIAIQVDKISKQYDLISERQRHDTIRELITERFRSAFSRNGRAQTRHTFWALKDVSLQVNKGEILGIIGNNGAGKSTLLKILSRVTEPTTGSAVIRGRVGSLLEVGTGFHWELTGRENIYLSGAILGMTKEEISEKFDEIVNFSELDRFLDMPVKRYSSGMYVRLAFSVAAHLRPDILLLDEVLSVGDLDFQRKCMDYAKSLKEDNATILLVSHNMFSIKSMCSRALCMEDGKILFDGPVAEAIEYYERNSSKIRDLRKDDAHRFAVHLTDMTLSDEEGNPCYVFDHGQRMRIRLKLKATKPVHDPNIIVAFVRSDNVNCINFCTALDGFTLPSIDGESVIELLTPNLKLVAEFYTIHVVVRDRSFQNLHLFQIGPSFHIRHDLLNPHFGVFHEPARWSLCEDVSVRSEFSAGKGV
jgi:lipopolysaccharide transport system ATP-binding protein